MFKNYLTYFDESSKNEQIMLSNLGFNVGYS